MPCEFFLSVLVGGLTLKSENSKLHQLSKILHSILADLNNALVWKESIFSSNSLFLFFQAFRDRSEFTNYN